MPFLGAATLMQIIRNGIAVGTKRMKHKKLWIFIGIIVLILILNHIFGWSSYLGNTENLKFLENMVQENLVLAIGIYTILTIISCCGTCTSGGDICNRCRSGIWTGTLEPSVAP